MVETLPIRSYYPRTGLDLFIHHSLQVQVTKFLISTEIQNSKVGSFRLRSNLILVTFLKPTILNFPSDYGNKFWNFSNTC